MNELVLKALQASQKALNGLIDSPATIEQIAQAGKGFWLRGRNEIFLSENRAGSKLIKLQRVFQKSAP